MGKVDCICITCGTSKTNGENGYCKNGHDNWLEEDDHVALYLEASKNLKISVKELYKKLKSKKIYLKKEGLV